MSGGKPADAYFQALMPNTLHSYEAPLVISEPFTQDSEEELLILTAQKAGFMPALPLTLHFLSKVDSFLATATLVSSSKRHPVSMQGSLLFTFLIHCI